MEYRTPITPLGLLGWLAALVAAWAFGHWVGSRHTAHLGPEEAEPTRIEWRGRAWVRAKSSDAP